MEILITLAIFVLLFVAILWLLLDVGHAMDDPYNLSNEEDEYEDVDNWGKQ